MVNKDSAQPKDTERKILDAARGIFENKGFDGARMQEIADEAGINKSLLHYYFRSKTKLFDEIFIEAFKDFWPSIEDVAQKEDAGIRDLVRTAVNGYIDILSGMPFLAAFIVGEVNRSPDRVRELMEKAGIQPQRSLNFIQQAIDKGEILPMDPREFIVNLVALSVFPFLSRPLISRMFWESQQEYDRFLQTRRDSLVDFICRSVLVEKNQTDDFS